jgi:hypothetical protein
MKPVRMREWHARPADLQAAVAEPQLRKEDQDHQQEAAEDNGDGVDVVQGELDDDVVAGSDQHYQELDAIGGIEGRPGLLPGQPRHPDAPKRSSSMAQPCVSASFASREA